MNYSESSLVDYHNDEGEENDGNACVDHAIQVVSDVERRVSRDSNKSPATDGHDDIQQARTKEPGATVPDARAGVNEGAVMVATGRTSTNIATVIECSRSAGGDWTENSMVHLGEPVEPAMHVGSSPATLMAATRSQSA